MVYVHVVCGHGAACSGMLIRCCVFVEFTVEDSWPLILTQHTVSLTPHTLSLTPHTHTHTLSHPTHTHTLSTHKHSLIPTHTHSLIPTHTLSLIPTHSLSLMFLFPKKHCSSVSQPSPFPGVRTPWYNVLGELHEIERRRPIERGTGRETAD